MTKLLFYTDSGYFSGAEIYLSHLINAAAEAGEEVEVVVSKIFQNVTHPAWQLVIANPKVKISYIANGYKLNIGYYFRLKRSIKASRPDLIICNMWSPFANTFLLMAAHRLRRPVLAIEHFYQEKVDIKGLTRPIKLWAYAFKKSLVPYFVTVSNAHKRVLVEEFSYPSEKISILHPGVKIAVGQTVKSDQQIVQLIFLGTLEERKDPLFIIEVLGRLKDLPWQIKFLGKGPLDQAIKDRVAQLGLNDKVELVGWVNNAGAILDQSDILVHPARSENFSGVLIEAEAHGLAIVANNVGGNGEIVADGVSGRLLTAGNTDEWATSLRELITNPELRERLGQAGQAQYQKSLTLDTMKANFSRLVKSITHPDGQSSNN